MERIFMKSSTAYIRQLVKDISCGKIGIPVFQRNFVWKPEQILDLFDSIHKGYPVGTVLLWAPDEEILCKDIITDKVIPDYHPTYYVLDGRQRLTTFFGCISADTNKPACYKVAYNLKTDSFEYTKKNDPLSIQVSEIFDTFKMLGRLQEIVSQEADSSKVQLYADRAKEMNSILQEYMVNQVSLEHCTLEQARIVFSRINSKGTDISRAAMLQAVTYNEGGHLLTNAIQDIRALLVPYNFDGLSEDEILNCFFRYENKKFYDVSMKEMEQMDFMNHENDVKEVVVKAVKFLYEECGVTHSLLLPYTKQLYAFTWLFKENPDLSPELMQEAKKWFVYTTSQQIFQNGSLKNTRNVFNRFESFIKGDICTAIDYMDWNVPSLLDFKFTKKSARSIFMLLALQNVYRQHSAENCKSSYIGHVHFGGNNPACYFVLINQSDKQEISDILFSKTVNLADYEDKFKRHCLDWEMVQAFRKGDMNSFIALRTKEILASQKALLEPYAKFENSTQIP